MQCCLPANARGTRFFLYMTCSNLSGQLHPNTPSTLYMRCQSAEANAELLITEGAGRRLGGNSLFGVGEGATEPTWIPPGMQFCGGLAYCTRLCKRWHVLKEGPGFNKVPELAGAGVAPQISQLLFIVGP